MSYDTSIIIDTGGEYPAEVEDIGNYTSNVSEMYRLAMPGPYAGGGKYDGVKDLGEERVGLPGISGLQCTQAAEILRLGIVYMEEHRKELIKLEPENGWGSYQGALDYLRKIHDACVRHPKATLAVNW